MVYKRRRGLVRARRRRHELAHHDGIRVLGYFGIHFFEAEFPVEVVGRLVVPDAGQEELRQVPLSDDLLGAAELSGSDAAFPHVGLDQDVRPVSSFHDGLIFERSVEDVAAPTS